MTSYLLGQVMCVQYWPVLVDREEEFGDISVTLLKEEQLANFIIRTIKLRKDGEVRLVSADVSVTGAAMKYLFSDV